MTSTPSLPALVDRQIGQQAAAQLPWFQLVTLLTTLRDTAEREWCALHAAQHDWSRTTLACLASTGCSTPPGRGGEQFCGAAAVNQASLGANIRPSAAY